MTPEELAERICSLLSQLGPQVNANVIDEKNVIGVEIDDTMMFVTVENV